MRSLKEQAHDWWQDHCHQEYERARLRAELFPETVEQRRRARRSGNHRRAVREQARARLEAGLDAVRRVWAEEEARREAAAERAAEQAAYRAEIEAGEWVRPQDVGVTHIRALTDYERGTTRDMPIRTYLRRSEAVEAWIRPPGRGQHVLLGYREGNGVRFIRTSFDEPVRPSVRRPTVRRRKKK